MKICITINDDTIRRDVTESVEFAEWDNFISFPDETAKSEFIDDCTDEVISKYEIYAGYNPKYAEIVLDMAESYGYAI